MRTGDGDTYPNQYDSPKLKQMVLGAGTPIFGHNLRNSSAKRSKRKYGTCFMDGLA